MVRVALAGLVGAIWTGLGFVIGSPLLLALTARAFGRRALLADIVIGLVISLFIFFVFNRLLKLALPVGPIEQLLEVPMDALIQLLNGFEAALQPMNIAFAAIGMLLGTAIGVLPGIGPALTVALLLPVTFKLDPGGSLIMFAGIYYGGMYGGSTTAILLNTPGEAASVVTALEVTRWPAKAAAGRLWRQRP